LHQRSTKISSSIWELSSTRFAAKRFFRHSYGTLDLVKQNYAA